MGRWSWLRVTEEHLRRVHKREAERKRKADKRRRERKKQQA